MTTRAQRIAALAPTLATTRRPYTRKEVAAMFGVAAKTVTRWGRDGKLPPGVIVRTPGGQYRYRAELLDEWLKDATT